MQLLCVSKGSYGSDLLSLHTLSDAAQLFPFSGAWEGNGSPGAQFNASEYSFTERTLRNQIVGAL